MALAEMLNVTKLFFFVIDEMLNRLEFVPRQLFQPSLIFMDKARSWPYSQILDKAGKSGQGQTLKLNLLE
jgi:hypothetical protein